MAHNRRSYYTEYDNAQYAYYGMDIGDSSMTAPSDPAERQPRPYLWDLDNSAQPSVLRRTTTTKPDRAESYRSPYIVGYDYNSQWLFSDPYSQDSPTTYVNIDGETVQPTQREITQTEGSTKKRKKKVRPKIQGLSYIIAKFADITSMNGPPYIVRSKSYFSKFAWTILMIAAFGALGWNLSSIFGKYLEYKKISKVDIKFSSLPFPAVTICNFNIVRLSQIINSTGPLNSLVNALKPESLKISVNSCDLVTNFDVSSCLHVILKKIQESVATVPPPEYYYEYEYDRQYADEEEYYKESWEGESEESDFDNVTKRFKEYLLDLTEKTLQEMGHQIEDMLLECSFAGRKCYPKNFTHFYSNNYGNCYTLQHEKFISRTSGPSGGLELVLYLETEEYIPYITTNNGIRVVIHEQNSLPFPDENGLSVMPGTNTFIGIKQVNVTRLRTKYDNCSDDEYRQMYNFIYTLYTCQSICEYNRILAECNCSSNANREIQKVLGNVSDTQYCRNKTDCVRTKHFDQDTTQCDCKNPCQETVYQEVISSTRWPTPEYATIFSIPICHVKNHTCGLTGENIIQEFVKLNIFYQDLNHQVIVEKADYEIYQLFSDIGGTLGLWIGLSVLGIFEVVHLIIRVAVFLCTGRCAQTKPK